jgi:hypothetical protein
MATEFCPNCGTARSGSFRFCRSCGLDFDAAVAPPSAASAPPPPTDPGSGWVSPAPPADPGPGWVTPAASPRKGRGCTPWLLAFAVLVVVALVYSSYRGTSGGDTPGKTDPPAAAKQLVGTFLRWEPVDESNGYAYFSIKNNGSSSAVAECTVRVSNDFGNFGFDFLVGETVAAGKTVTGKMAISVGEGSALINEGVVEDC